MKGKGILALLASAPKRGADDEEPSGDDEMTEPSEAGAEEMAAEDMIDCIKSGDAKGMVRAYRRLKSACEMAMGGDEGDEAYDEG